MKRMRFDVECVSKFLYENDLVFSVRGYDYGEDCYVYVFGNGNVYLRKKLGKVVSKVQLVKFVRWSGFENVDEWWKVIRRFVKEGRNMWLYRLDLVCGAENFVEGKVEGDYELWNREAGIPSQGVRDSFVSWEARHHASKAYYDRLWAEASPRLRQLRERRLGVSP